MGIGSDERSRPRAPHERRHRVDLPGGPDHARPRPAGTRDRRAGAAHGRDRSPRLRQGVQVPRRRAGAHPGPCGRARRCRGDDGGDRRSDGDGRRIVALLPVRGHRRHPVAGRGSEGRRNALPCGRVPRWLPPPVLGADRRGRTPVGLPGRRRDVHVGRHPQVRMDVQGRLAGALPREVAPGEAVLPL